MKTPNQIRKDIESIRKKYPRRADLRVYALNNYGSTESEKYAQQGDMISYNRIICYVKSEMRLIKKHSKLSASALLVIECFD